MRVYRSEAWRISETRVLEVNAVNLAAESGIVAVIVEVDKENVNDCSL